MPMFDDPNQELNRLQENLLADETDDALAGLAELLKDYEPTDLESRVTVEPKEKVSVHQPKKAKKAADTMSEALLNEEDMEVQPAKEKGIGGLVALCVVETVAIIGLLAWWFLCLR